MNKLIQKYKALPQTVRAGMWFLLMGILQRGISFFTTPIFTRILTKEEYGEFTTFSSWMEILGVILTLRLSFGVFMQGLVRYDNDKDEYTSALQGLTSLISCIGLCIYLVFHESINSFTKLTTPMTLALIAIVWAGAMFGFWSTRQRVEFKYRALVILTFSVALVQPMVGVLVVLASRGNRVEARVISMAVVQLVFYGWIFVYYMRKGKKFYDKDFWIHALKFNIPLIPHYLSQSFLHQSDRIIIRQLAGAAPAAIYGLASSLAWVMNVVNQSLLNTFNPWIYQQIKAKDFKRLANVSYLLLIGVGLANLVLVAFAPEVIPFLGPSYEDAIMLVPPLSASVFITFMYALFADFEFYYERTSLVMLASIMGAGVNIGLNYLLIPRSGYQIASWTTLVGYAIYVFMHYLFMRYVQKKDMGGIRVYDPKIILGICAGFGLICALLMAVYDKPLIRIAFVVALCILVFACRKQLMAIWKDLRSAKGKGKQTVS